MITKFSFKDKTIKSYAIRKLTPKECFRLMGVCDATIRIMQSTVAQAKERVKGWFGKGKDYDMSISASQQYKQAGNSIVVDVLEKIYEQLWYPKPAKQKAQPNMLDTFFPSESLPLYPKGYDPFEHWTEDGKVKTDAVCTDTSDEKVILTTFSGYDSQLLACDSLRNDHPDFRWSCAGWSDIDKYAIQMHDLIFPQFADRALGDITKIDWHKVKENLNGKEIDLFTYSSPCFVAGTLVQTIDGYKPIEDVTAGDKVLTHTNEYRNVITPMTRLYRGVLYTVDAMCGKVECTDEHPFYVRTRCRNAHMQEITFTEPRWAKAKELTEDDYLGMPVNNKSQIPVWDRCEDEGLELHKATCTISSIISNADFWYVIGRYVGHGWQMRGANKGIVIGCSEHNKESIANALDRLNVEYCVTHERTGLLVQIAIKEWMDFVERYGECAYGKRIDMETINLPSELLSAFLKGCSESDEPIVNGCRKITTDSEQLAYGIGYCITAAYRKPYRLCRQTCESANRIEGHTANQHDTFQIWWNDNDCLQDKAFYENGYIWFPIHHIASEYAECHVYNMEVETDNSYVANNIIVHNCQDISQAGKQMGLQEDSGTRSSLLWNVADAVEILKPKYLLQENVSALVSKKFIGDFELWLKKLESIGYVNRWALLNAKDYGVPQNRLRVFCLSMRKDVAFDYHFPEPVALERHLEDVLEQEVDERYFLNDDAVGKFLRTNDKDDAVFHQFAIPPTHKDAMFLKTWMTFYIAAVGGWGQTPTGLDNLLTQAEPAFSKDYDEWRNNGKFPSDEFEHEFDGNLNN